MKNVLQILLTLAWLAPVPALAADYQGADAILKRASGMAKPTPVSDDTPEKLRKELKAFREDSATLPPSEAASRWLEMVDQFLKLSPADLNFQKPSAGEEPLNVQLLVQSLPPPAAWDALATAVAARKDSGNIHTVENVLLRMIAHRLTSNNDALAADLTALESILKKSAKMDKRIPDQITTALKERLLAESDDAAVILKNLEDRLQAVSKEGDQRAETFSVPDLVSLAGEDKAADFLRTALQSNVRISIENGDETLALARKLALENVAKLKVPQWPLVNSIDSTALYEALNKQFPHNAESEQDDHYDEAGAYYLLGLIASHRTADAAAFAAKLGGKTPASLPDEGMEALERAGFTTELTDFFHDLLAQNPDLPFWSDYVALAVKAGKQQEMVKLAEASAARQGLDDERHLGILQYLRKAYLAVDRVDDGIAIFRKEIAEAKKTQPNENRTERAPSYEIENVFGIALDFARLGAVLERKDLVDEGVQAARDAVKKRSPDPKKQSEYDNQIRDLAVFFVEIGRAPEAEAILADDLALLASIPQKMSGRSDTGTDARPALVLLSAIYHAANRPADVISLLDHAPQWNAKEVGEILTEDVTIDRNTEYMGYFAADALAARGRKPEALKILNALMDRKGGYDPAFELLIKLAPHDEAIARCDELFDRDKNEPRPLIWKAKLLLDAGKLEEAEAVARQAVTVDPSDGEHGPGRRMRVYAVLADIRAARGDNKEAETLRGAVTAIRHSEEADRFYNADLITQAIKMYEEALTHFEDAYCIQSRLALRMVEVGDAAGAEEHYRKAYELMPDSFGRVESHCFGCERAFDGKRAQSIAEKVFTELATKRPDKPQVHYLLGYLRMEENRYREALPEFREAVKLDPDYLNAWKEIAEIGQKMRLPAAERDSIPINLLRLDPLSRHSSHNLSTIIDLRAGWNALAAASKLEPAPQTDLYPLAAAANEIAKREKESSTTDRMAMYQLSDYRENDLDPGKFIAQNPFIAEASQILQYIPRFFPEE